MLDGILGRGFTVKCKSLIKPTRTRIEVVRKRAEAKQRFLKEDLGKLLANGLDINAYGRTEEYIAGKNLLSCYDFLDQSCEYILNQLSRMQKLEECPEECKEVIASLMYAAARFSDLPELRDLRDTFQERYGNGFEVYVNQKFVEKLSPKSPPSEKRIWVLRDVASEFSIKWDAKGFEKRMASPTVVAQVQAEVHKVDMVKQRNGLPDEKGTARKHGESNVGRRDEANHHATGTKDVNERREKSLSKKGGSSSQGEYDSLYHARQFPTENGKHPYPVEKADRELKAEKLSRSSHGKLLDKRDRELKADKSSHSSHGKLLDNGHTGDTRSSNGVYDAKKGESMDSLFYEREKFASSYKEHQGKSENSILSYEHSNQDKTKDPMKKDQEEGDSVRLRSLSNYPLPPPYVKSKDKAARPPYVKQKEDKHRHNKDSVYAGSDPNENFLDPAATSNRSNKVNSSNNEHEHDHDRGERSAAPAKAQSYGHENDFDYHDEQIPLPKPRSLRRKHHKSSSTYDAEDSPEDVGIARTSSSSRRKDHSRRGLHILFDEDHHRKDDEEKMIDKLLLHYSKKPSNYDPGKLRKKVPGQKPSSHRIPETGESSMNPRSDRSSKKDEAAPPTRSVSLPPAETFASPEVPNKVYNRANSFQGDNQVRHVHPKLPDYDDLAARFAALKGR